MWKALIHAEIMEQQSDVMTVLMEYVQVNNIKQPIKYSDTRDRCLAKQMLSYIAS